MEEETAFHSAARLGNLEAMQIMYQQDPTILYSYTAESERTAYHIAIIFDHLPILEWLLSQSIEPMNKLDSKSQTPIGYGIAMNRFSVLTRIWKLYPKLAQGRDGDLTPLHLAALYNRPKIVRLLIQIARKILFPVQPWEQTFVRNLLWWIETSTSDLNRFVHASCSEGTPIMVAAKYNSVEVIAILGKFEPAIYDFRPYDQGDVAIHIAARFGHISAIQALIEATSEPILDLPGYSQRTPLQYAVYYRQIDTARYLLASGCRVRRSDGLDDIVIQNDSTKMLAVLMRMTWLSFGTGKIQEAHRNGSYKCLRFLRALGSNSNLDPEFVRAARFSIYFADSLTWKLLFPRTLVERI